MDRDKTHRTASFLADNVDLIERGNAALAPSLLGSAASLSPECLQERVAESVELFGSAGRCEPHLVSMNPLFRVHHTRPARGMMEFDGGRKDFVGKCSPPNVSRFPNPCCHARTGAGHSAARATYLVSASTSTGSDDVDKLKTTRMCPCLARGIHSTK